MSSAVDTSSGSSKLRQRVVEFVNQFNGVPGEVVEVGGAELPVTVTQPQNDVAVTVTEVVRPKAYRPTITINLGCRIIIIVCFLCWAGIIPTEKRYPSSVAWVAFVDFVTNVMVILPAIVDVIFRHKMDWFYRRPYSLPFLAKIPPTWLNVTGFNMLYMILSVALPIGIYIVSYRDLTKIALNLSLASSIIVPIIRFLDTLKKNRPPDHWFFGRSYGQNVLEVLFTFLGLVSWFWIALHICAVNIFLREQHLEHLRKQALTLKVGLAVQFSLLLVFFSLRIVFLARQLGYLKYDEVFDEKAWKHHMTALVAVLVLFCVTVAVGFSPDKLPNIFMVTS